VTRSRARDEAGQAGSTLLLIVVLVVVVIAVVLLQRTASTAEAINKKAATISATGRGINDATDSVLQLDKTNQYASSILATAQPLQGKLSTIVGLAQSIDGLAKSINASAGTINGTAGAINTSAGAINGTAGGINATAGKILGTAQSINKGVATINQNLDATIAVATQIKSDTGNILTQANAAKHEAGCINGRLGGSPAGTC
jgi:methyl-accepting chemotaxis protein